MGFPIFIGLGYWNRKRKGVGYGSYVLLWPHFDSFVYTPLVLGTTSHQGIEACQFYHGVHERSMERSGVRPKIKLD